MLWDKNRDLPSCHVQGTGGRGQPRPSTRLNKPRAASILLDTVKIRPAHLWVPFVSLAVKSINHCVNGVSEFLETADRFLISLHFSQLRVSSLQSRLARSVLTDQPWLRRNPWKEPNPTKVRLRCSVWSCGACSGCDDAFTAQARQSSSCWDLLGKPVPAGLRTGKPFHRGSCCFTTRRVRPVMCWSAAEEMSPSGQSFHRDRHVRPAQVVMMRSLTVSPAPGILVGEKWRCVVGSFRPEALWLWALLCYETNMSSCPLITKCSRVSPGLLQTLGFSNFLGLGRSPRTLRNLVQNKKNNCHFNP